MKRIFQNKKFTFLLVVLTLVAVLLLLCLFTSLSQMASIEARLGELKQLIDSLDGQLKESQELKEYLQSNEYLISWAIKEGLLPEDATGWVLK